MNWSGRVLRAHVTRGGGKDPTRGGQWSVDLRDGENTDRNLEKPSNKGDLLLFLSLTR